MRALVSMMEENEHLCGPRVTYGTAMYDPPIGPSFI